MVGALSLLRVMALGWPYTQRRHAMSRKTTDDLEARVRAADARVRAARATAARLRREMTHAAAACADAAARVAGMALLNWCAGDERVRASAVRYLRDHVTSDTDRAALMGTPLDLSEDPEGAAGRTG